MAAYLDPWNCHDVEGIVAMFAEDGTYQGADVPHRELSSAVGWVFMGRRTRLLPHPVRATRGRATLTTMEAASRVRGAPSRQ